MKFFFVFFLSFFFNSAAPASECLFPPTVDGEEWDIFWAQHLVGADLLREEIGKVEFSREELHKIVGIWDTDNNGHGEVVSHIVAGPYPSAVIPTDRVLKHSNLKTSSSYTGNYERFFRECSENGFCPTYINNSQSWLNDSIVYSVASDLNSRGSTMVVAAGSKRIPVEMIQRESARNGHIILVASLDPKWFAVGL